jgi:hypothetical protein
MKGGNTAQWADYPGWHATPFSVDVVLISAFTESNVWMVLFVYRQMELALIIFTDDSCMGPLRLYQRRCMVEVSRLAASEGQSQYNCFSLPSIRNLSAYREQQAFISISLYQTFTSMIQHWSSTLVTLRNNVPLLLVCNYC